MPVYEYICRSYKRRTSFFARTMEFSQSPACSHCGSRDMERAQRTHMEEFYEVYNVELANTPLTRPCGNGRASTTISALTRLRRETSA